MDIMFRGTVPQLRVPDEQPADGLRKIGTMSLDRALERERPLMSRPGYARAVEFFTQGGVRARQFVRARTRAGAPDMPRDPKQPTDESGTECPSQFFGVRRFDPQSFQQPQLIVIVEFDDPVIPPRVDRIPTLQ